MKILSIAFFSVLLYFSSFSQTRTEISGKWIVEKAELPVKPNMTEDQKEMMDLILTEFSRSSFEFDSKQQANFNIRLSDYYIYNAFWVYNKELRTIAIRDKKSKAVLMQLFVRPVFGNTMKFYVQDTPFVLTVKKVSDLDEIKYSYRPKNNNNSVAP
ncbi:hypothetical protein OO013_05335 [Mangrovivirga sp. M17]|uniref:DUF4468 domain-containing protein n=1 Tax=Mangrovivirga halotolerans TaxID=2993936 RepID=A0ABT3RN94_9BACT|nr:hypothetical protein [Mangrovivirga halotolerans]MCX2743276.1 hypothetical protein [Mangrovivirga halotolerans]